MTVPGWWTSSGGVPFLTFVDPRPVESIVAIVGGLTLLALALLVGQTLWNRRPRLLRRSRRHKSTRHLRALLGHPDAWAGAHR